MPWSTLTLSDWAVSKTNVYEREIWSYVSCSQGGTAIDVGAHQGFYTTKLAKEAGPQGLVIAFEPEPENLRFLKANLTKNDLTNVMIEEKALSNYVGTGTMFMYPHKETKPDSAKHFLRGSHPQEPMYTEFQTRAKIPGWFNVPQSEVEVTALDPHLGMASPPWWLKSIDIIKIDTEGAELRILEGAQETLQRYSPVVILEEHFGMFKELLEFMDSLAYRLVAYGPLTENVNSYAVFRKR